MADVFGTDGVRGVANVGAMSPEAAMAMGRAAAQVLTSRGNDTKSSFVVGRDTRISGTMLEAALIAGLCSAGADVIQLGVIPSGGVAYLTRRLQATAGVMVSASHNPYADNGIKLFSPSGAKIEPAAEREIETRLKDLPDTFPRPTGHAIGRCRPCPSAQRNYIDFLKSTFCGARPLGLRVGVDCANGAASHIAPALFQELGAEVWVLHASPDGVNINGNCGSLHPESLRERVLAENMEVGFALDGDADRLTVVDNTGEVLDGDNILAICAGMLAEGDQVPRTVVGTVMANWGLRQALRGLNCALHVVPVGDRQVVQGMRRTGAVLGGEPSGHVIFPRHIETSDGLITALQLLRAMQKGPAPMSELARNFDRSPQVLANVELARRSDPMRIESVRDAIERAKRELGESGRVLVRLSGTEPVARVLLEGPEASTLAHLSADICGAIEAELGTAGELLPNC